MAFTKFIILTAVIAASVNAKFWDDDDDWPNFPQPRMPVPPTPPFQPFAPFPPFGPGFGFFPNIPFPPIQMPVIPTPEQIGNFVPGPGQMFQGAAVHSSSSLTYDKDGNPVRSGGTSIRTNNNGVVREIREGNAPPNLDTPIWTPPFPDFPTFKPIEFPAFPEIKPLKMPTFKPITPMDPEKMKNYVPKDGETFSAVSKSSFSNSKTINGKTVSDGGASILVNDNGSTDEEHVAFHKGDKDADEY